MRTEAWLILFFSLLMVQEMYKFVSLITYPFDELRKWIETISEERKYFNYWMFSIWEVEEREEKK